MTADTCLKICYVGPLASGRASSLAALVGHIGDPAEVRQKSHRLSIAIDGLETCIDVVANVHRGHVFYRGPEDPNLPPAVAREIEDVVACSAFVAVLPCRKPRLEICEDTLFQLRMDLAAYGRDLDKIPVVFQLTQTDYADRLDPEWVRTHIRTAICDHVVADPRSGAGVREAIETLLRLYFRN